MSRIVITSTSGAGGPVVGGTKSSVARAAGGSPPAADPPDRRSHEDGSGAPPAAREPRELRRLWEALREVQDPEVPVSLVDLGLIYDVRRSGSRVDVDLSFTATACPAMGFIREDIRERLLREPGVRQVETHVVWEPAWSPKRITETGREQLRRFGISL